MFSPRRRRGFTLIELLTVIAVIGILAAILIPTVGKVRQRANYSRTLSQLRQIGTGLNLYAMDHKGVYPAPSAAFTWGYAIARENSYLGPATKHLHQELIAPGVIYENASGAAVAYNTYCATGTMCFVTQAGLTDVARGRPTSNVAAPSQAMLVFLAKQRAAKDGFSRTVVNTWNFTEIQSDLAATDIRNTVLFNFDLGTSMPVLMADGHVRGYNQAELQTVNPRANWLGIN